MDFDIPADIQPTLDALDAFIEREITPLEAAGRQRSASSTTGASGPAPTSRTAACPRTEWEELLREMRRRADAAGWLRLALPAEYGGRDATNLEMAIIREHLATQGPRACTTTCRTRARSSATSRPC